MSDRRVTCPCGRRFRTRSAARECLPCRTPVLVAEAVPGRVAARVSAHRAPLPAGSTASWGAITRGTVLDGAVFVPLLPGRS